MANLSSRDQPKAAVRWGSRAAPAAFDARTCFGGPGWYKQKVWKRFLRVAHTQMKPDLRNALLL